MRKISKKQFLLYANYYYPELASTSMLCVDLCEGLKDEYDVTVICSVPCYAGPVEEKYLTKQFYFEEYNGVKVIRVRVPTVNKRSKMSRIKNIIAYFLGSVFATFKAPKPDVIMTQSQPPVLGGLLGVIGKVITTLRFKKTKLAYVIHDYNPEQIEAIGYCNYGLILKVMMLADKFSCRFADKVIVVGKDMVDTMKRRFTKKNGEISKAMPKTVLINNWMDEKYVYQLPENDEMVLKFKKEYGLQDKFVIMYSGNMGLFYDLPNIFKVIEKFKDREDIVFPFVGEGALKEELVEYVKEHNMKNVVFIPYQAKEALAFSMNSADVHWIVNAKGIKGVSCPSKLYGILAVSKPCLGVLEEGTEARDVIETQNCGMAVSPTDYDGIERLINEFALKTKEELDEMGKRGCAYMKNNLTKEISIEKYKKELSGL